MINQHRSKLFKDKLTDKELQEFKDYMYNKYAVPELTIIDWIITTTIIIGLTFVRITW